MSASANATPYSTGNLAGLHWSPAQMISYAAHGVCPEFIPAQAQEWIAAGDVPELAQAKHLDFVDIDSATGRWSASRPNSLASSQRPPRADISPQPGPLTVALANQARQPGR